MYNFNKITQEGQTFMNRLATNLGHPDDEATTGRVLKAVLHVFRDSIQLSEAFDFMAQKCRNCLISNNRSIISPLSFVSTTNDKGLGTNDSEL